MSTGSDGETPAGGVAGGDVNPWMATLLVLVGLCVLLQVMFFVLT